MATYLAKVHARGQIRTEEIEAANTHEAEAKASRHGVVIAVKRARAARASGLSYGDRQVFLSQLAAMLASRVGTTESLTLIRDTFHGRIQQVAHGLLTKVQSGMTIPDAVAAQGRRYFPGTVVAMIRAGAEAGSTATALREAAAFEHNLHDIRRSASRGIWMALGAFLAGVVFVLATAFWMVPKIMRSPLVQMTGGSKQFAHSVSFAYGAGYVALAIMVVLGVLVLLGTVGRAVAPVAADAVILRIPLYRDVALSRSRFIVFYGLGLLVKTGVRMEQALDLLAGATHPGAIREDLLRARDAVRLGQPWAPAMRTLQATDRAALGASKDRAQVADAMGAIALAYRDLYAHRVAALAPVLQVLAALGLILSGGLMFGLTVLPVIQMSTKVLQ